MIDQIKFLAEFSCVTFLTEYEAINTFFSVQGLAGPTSLQFRGDSQGMDVDLDLEHSRLLFLLGLHVMTH